MGKKQKGSFTVEASILVPFILFILMAVIYLLFFLHDRAILQSCALREGEKILWQQSEVSENSAPLLMMQLLSESASTDGSLAGRLLNGIQSFRTAKVHMKGQMHIGIAGSAELAGPDMTADTAMQALRVAYTDDWLKTFLINRLKAQKD